MTYAEGRIVHDADSHVVETPDWLEPWADDATRARMKPIYVGRVRPGEESEIDLARARRLDPDDRERAEHELMLRKNWNALGSFVGEDRPRALDLLGFRSQLVFNTFVSQLFVDVEHSRDPDLVYGIAAAHNRAMIDFCSTDRRLLATAYVPLVDFERARVAAEDAIAMGAKAILISSACPPGHSPSHGKLFPVWAAVQEAGLPLVFHVGGGGRLLDPSYFENGLPPVPDFHGGAENFRSVDFMAIPHPPMLTLSTMIFDRVLDHFPRLKIGVIEQGAVWVPSWMRLMDTAVDAFRKNEERLQKLALRPSDYVKRQIRVTPYPAEPVGWIIEQAGEDICLFSTDYPHVEGGRHPIKRFDASLGAISEAGKQRFYSENFEDLMGDALPR
jgi:predicted TIM-barrel fold metal-dependent hydrolase